MTRAACWMAVVCLTVDVAIAADGKRNSTAKPRRLPSGTVAAIDDAIGEEMARQQLVGVAVGIVRGGQVVFTKGYGLADRENEVAVTSQTIFNWASNSKPMAAVLALQLVEQKKLNLDADIRKYVPEFPSKGPPITTRQLLCHQSGLPHWNNGTVIPSKDLTAEAQRSIDPLSSILSFSESPLLFDPGARFSYSSYGYILLSAVIERAGKEPFVDQIQKRIAEPLGMTSLQLDMPTRGQPNWSVGYAKERGGRIVRAQEFAHAWKMGAGGFKSDVGDFAKWANALLSRRLLTRKSSTQMWTAQKTSSGETTNWGLGIAVDSRNSEVEHSGRQQEVTTELAFSLKYNEAIVAMCNCGYGKPAQIVKAIGSILHPSRGN